MRLLIHIDGACRGNPGPSSVGVVLRDGSGRTLKEHGRRIGRTTNNVAEYTALIDAMRLARDLGGTELTIHSDSQLLVRQFNGQYKVKAAHLVKCLVEAQSLRRAFARLELVHVPREQNKDADRLANSALDSAGGS